MNFKDFLANKAKPPELYWTLVLEEGWVQAGVWFVGEKTLETLTTSQLVHWESDTELVSACDAVLSSCISKLSDDNSEPEKTVFGVPPSWVKNGEIADEYLIKIKSVCTELSLVPVGFATIPEAIAHLYKSEEESPLSAVVVGLGKNNIEVSVFKMGNLVGNSTVARSVSVTEDLEEGLQRFESAMPLPSRIILYDGKDGELEDAKEEISKKGWEELGKIKFLHTPKLESVSGERKVLATSLAGGAEIGEVTKVNTKNEESTGELSSLPIKEEGDDLLPEVSSAEISNVHPPEKQTTPEELGFVVEGVNAPEVHSRPEDPKVNTQKPFLGQIKSDSYLHKTKSILHSFTTRFRSPKPKFTVKTKMKSYYIVGALIIMAILGLALYSWFIPKAKVTVYVTPKTYQDTISITFNTEGKADMANTIIPGELITAEKSGEKTISTTGTKLIGEKAKGTVQIANGNGNPINLAAGTNIVSSGGLRFVTDSTASVSGQLLPGSPGTATLNVTAADIGAQYNLAKDEIFKVGLFDKSQVAATSQSDFSGGNSQQIAAVSAEDQKKVKSELEEELTLKIKEDLSVDLSADKLLVDDLSLISTKSETYNHKPGEVADSLSLNLVLMGSVISVDRQKILQYAVEILKSKIPQGYALKNNQIKFNFSFVEQKDKDFKFNTGITADFTPQINSKEKARLISGKSQKELDSLLSDVPGFSRVSVLLNNKLPFFGNRLPRLPGNITIDIDSE